MPAHEYSCAASQTPTKTRHISHGCGIILGTQHMYVMRCERWRCYCCHPNQILSKSVARGPCAAFHRYKHNNTSFTPANLSPLVLRITYILLLAQFTLRNHP